MSDLLTGDAATLRAPLRAGLPPGPRLPKLLQTYIAFHHTAPAGRLLRRLYGDTFTLKLYPWGTVVVIGDPSAIREIFAGEPEVFHAGEGNTLLEPVLGRRSVLLLDEEEHLRERRGLLPAFHGELARRHEQLIERLVLDEMRRCPRKKPFALYPHLRAITLEVTLQVVIGVTDPERQRALRKVLPKTVAAGPLISLMWMVSSLGNIGPWRSYSRHITEAHSLLAEEIASRRHATDLAERTDALSTLIKLGRLDDESLRDQIMSMLLGHETTASTLAWAIERLLRHPRALARAREGDAAYLDAVIKETLRVRHIIPIVTRRLTRTVNLAGYRLPAGITLLPAIAFVHENPALFSAPRDFCPERFLNGDEGSTYTWIPFGGGVRRCLGMGFASLQMRVILRTILKGTNLTAPSRRDERMTRPSWIAIVPGRGVRVTRTV